MFVKDRMSSPAITLSPETPFQEALRVMQTRKIRRIPLVDADQQLVGIVSERDLLHAAPSPATSLSVWELNYLLWKLKLSDMMTQQVYTVTPLTPLETAAQILVERKIGGLPVVDEANRVVGVITETDIFKAFAEMMGSDVSGVRLVLALPSGQDTEALVTRTIFELDGDLHYVAVYAATPERRHMLLKVRGVRCERLVQALSALDPRIHIVDAREA